MNTIRFQTKKWVLYIRFCDLHPCLGALQLQYNIVTLWCLEILLQLAFDVWPFSFCTRHYALVRVFWYFVTSIYCLRYLDTSIFYFPMLGFSDILTIRCFAFDIFSVDISSIRSYAIWYFATSIACVSIFYDSMPLRFDSDFVMESSTQPSWSHDFRVGGVSRPRLISRFLSNLS